MNKKEENIEEYKNEKEMEFVKVPKGSFAMKFCGEYEGDKNNYKIEIGDNLHVGKYTVTKAQWKEIMGTNPWFGRKDINHDDNSPAVWVSYKDAEKFVEKLNEITPESEHYRIPSEAEWEYACRAGTTTKYNFGNDEKEMDKYAWFQDNSSVIGERCVYRYTHEVGQKLPNNWGLYDMHGNVDEWCDDDYEEDGREHKIIRGGCYDNVTDALKSNDKAYEVPEDSCFNLGFRLVMELNK